MPPLPFDLTLPALLAAACLALAYGVIWTWRPHPLTSWPRSATKTAAAALLAIWGWQIGAAPLAILGVALGALGDLFLSRPGDRAFLAGMAAFALGHLAYAALFVAGMSGGAGWPVTLAVLALALSTEVWLAPHTGALRWPVRGYVVVITVMLWTAVSPSLAPAWPWVALGALLFAASDLLLGVERFVLHSPRPRAVASVLLWPLYWLAQVLIVGTSVGAG